MTRAQIVEQVAKIIAPPFRFSDGTEYDGDWELWVEEAEDSVALVERATILRFLSELSVRYRVHSANALGEDYRLASELFGFDVEAALMEGDSDG